MESKSKDWGPARPTEALDAFQETKDPAARERTGHPVRFMCADRCEESVEGGGTVATRSCSAYWDVKAQDWLLNEDMETPYCPACDGGVVEVVIPAE